MHPIVLSPVVSIFLAICKTSSLVMSWLAGITHSMIVLGSYMYFFIIFVVTSNMLFAWPSIGILVKPGRSIIVKFGQLEEYISKMIGKSMIFLRFPHTFSVNFSIDYLTFAKFVIVYGN